MIYTTKQLATKQSAKVILEEVKAKLVDLVTNNCTKFLDSIDISLNEC